MDIYREFIGKLVRYSRDTKRMPIDGIFQRDMDLGELCRLSRSWPTLLYK